MQDGRTAIVGFTKIGTYVQNAPEELWFLASDNLLADPADPADIKWRLLPDGDHGLLPPGGNPQVFEEAHILPLAGGGFWAVGRTSLGFLGAAQTRDPTARGKWTRTGFTTYWDPAAAPRALRPLPARAQPRGVTKGHPGPITGTGLKHPRGPLTPKRMGNGQVRRGWGGWGGGGTRGPSGPGTRVARAEL
jgi:hypothetical protein